MLHTTSFAFRSVVPALAVLLGLGLPAGPAAASEVVNLARLVLTGKWLSAEQRDRLAAARLAADNASALAVVSSAGPISPPLQLALRPHLGVEAL